MHLKSMAKNQHNQIVDHQYANNTYFIALSTLESLKLKVQNKPKSHFKTKLFSNYDKVDYSNKNQLQLQSQLQTHLILLKAAFDSYEITYRQSWIAPHNFNIQQSIDYATSIKTLFYEANDIISMNLAQDFITILQGGRSNLFIDQVQIKPNYTITERQNHLKSLGLNSMRAKEIMQNQGRQIQEKKFGNINELQGKMNPFYGSQITYKYIIVSKDDYDKLYKDNKGFHLSYLDENIIYFPSKQEAQAKMSTLKTKERKNYIILELQICCDTVFQINQIK